MSDQLFKPVVTESLAKQIADSLRNAILEGQLKADERLPTEEELAKRFEVSRPTVREALKRLAAQNLIRTRRGPSGGSFVARPSSEEARASLANTTMLLVSLDAFSLDELSEARRLLQSACLEAACANREDTHLEAMRNELAIQAHENTTDAEFCSSDVRFHRAIVDATGNGMLQFLLSALVEGLQPVSNLLITRFRAREAILTYHDQLFIAIETRNPDAAASALSNLIDYIKERAKEAQAHRLARETLGA